MQIMSVWYLYHAPTTTLIGIKGSRLRQVYIYKFKGYVRLDHRQRWEGEETAVSQISFKSFRSST